MRDDRLGVMFGEVGERLMVELGVRTGWGYAKGSSGSGILLLASSCAIVGQDGTSANPCRSSPYGADPTDALLRLYDAERAIARSGFRGGTGGDVGEAGSGGLWLTVAARRRPFVFRFHQDDLSAWLDSDDSSTTSCSSSVRLCRRRAPIGSASWN